MLYEIEPEEEDEICRNLLKKRAKILIPVGILYFFISAHSTAYHIINIQSCINHGE